MSNPTDVLKEILGDKLAEQVTVVGAISSQDVDRIDPAETARSFTALQVHPVATTYIRHDRDGEGELRVTACAIGVNYLVERFGHPGAEMVAYLHSVEACTDTTFPTSSQAGDWANNRFGLWYRKGVDGGFSEGGSQGARMLLLSDPAYVANKRAGIASALEQQAHLGQLDGNPEVPARAIERYLQGWDDAIATWRHIERQPQETRVVYPIRGTPRC